VNRQLIIGFLFTLPLSAAANGGAKPKTAAAAPVTNVITAPAPAPSGSRTLKMGDNDIETIQTRPRHNTMLIFQGGENVVFAGGGDTDPHRWVMESPSKTKQTNVFYVKPTRAGDDFTSDLNIVTSGNHSYSFRLVSCAACVPDLKVFISYKEPAPVVVPVDPHLEEIAGLTARVQKAEDSEKKALAAAVKTTTDAAETVERERNEFQEKYPLSLRTDFVYLRNKPPFLVRSIWTDDTHTYIQLAGEMTSIYTFVDGTPTLTMYHYRRGSETNVGTYVIDGVLDSGYLQLGKKSKLRFDRVKP
jgi:hypothetical protein